MHPAIPTSLDITNATKSNLFLLNLEDAKSIHILLDSKRASPILPNLKFSIEHLILKHFHIF